MDRDLLRRFVSDAVGRRLAAYLDSRGVPTVGVGVKLEEERNRRRLEVLGRQAGDVAAGREELTDAEVDWLLDGDLQQAVDDARAVIHGFDQLDPVRQAVLVDMAFDLGRPGLAGFKRMRAALVERNFPRAADELEDSVWFKNAGPRARRDAAAMRTGREAAVQTASATRSVH